MENVSLKKVTEHVLEEARMILPGIQALFGFQLIAVFSDGFARLPDADKTLHLMATGLTIVAIALLTAPAAYHRQVEPDSVSHTFARYGTKMLTFGFLPLMLSMSVDSYVITHLVLGRPFVAAGAALFVLSILGWFWYVVPHFAREKRLRETQDQKLPYVAGTASGRQVHNVLPE